MKAHDLTKRQKAVIAFIADFLEAEGRSPTLTEVAKGVGSSAVSTIHKHVQHLIEKGLLERSHGKGNNLVVAKAWAASGGQAPTPKAEPISQPGARLIPFCGDVAAGAPLIPETRALPIEVPNSIHRNRDEIFVLRVRGESMVEDAILDGDLVVLQRRGEYRNGDRIVALIDGEEATLKEYRKDAKGVWLVPHNPELKPICYSPDRIQVQGLVIGIMRSC
ncbi:MAG TPA: transcriptional repressor LexA [Holophagaceae bacterium]|nr:transcriptional repressor LexA [Holophagaceae bacterium]